MADYQPVSEADLEPAQGGTVASAAAPPVPQAAAPGGYQPVNDNDLAPAAPTMPTDFRGFRGGIPNSVAARFGPGDAFTRIFSAAATNAKNGFVNSFSALSVKDQQDLTAAGYTPGSVNSVGSALRYGANVFAAPLDALEDGFLSLGPAFIQGAGGAAEQAAREVGAGKEPGGEAEQFGRGVANIAEATLADIGNQHALAMVDAARANMPKAPPGGGEPPGGGGGGTPIDAAKAQAAVPGIYSQVWRVDQTPGGGIVQTPLGRLPSEAEAAGQAQTVATALHLPDSTADLIQKTYTDTGRPPAEVLMDAKTNAGGVLSDLVEGKVPTAYEGPARPLTTEELAAADVKRETSGKPTETQGEPTNEPMRPLPGGNEAERVAVSGTSSEVRPAETQASAVASQKAPAQAPAGTPIEPYVPGVSKIGRSIEQKAIDQGVTDGFLSTAGYDVKTVKGQTAMVEDFIADKDKMNAIVNGEQALPHGMDPSMFIAGVESYIEQTKDWDLAARLANSPVVTKTSEAAQTLRFAQERVPDSATAQLREIQQANQSAAVPPEVAAARKSVVKQAIKESAGPLLPKEELSWERFLTSIKC